MSHTESRLADVPGAALDDEESQAIFEAAWAADAVAETEADAQASGPAVVLDGPGAKATAGWTRYLAAAVVAVAAGLLGWQLVDQPAKPADGGAGPAISAAASGRLKGAGRLQPAVELTAMVGRRVDGHPQVGRRLANGASLNPGERVLFRYRLAATAGLALLGQAQGAPVEILWRSDQPVAAGDGEVQAGGQALGLDPARYNGAFRVALVSGASQAGTDVGALDMLTEGALRRWCGRCGVDLVQLEAP